MDFLCVALGLFYNLGSYLQYKPLKSFKSDVLRGLLPIKHTRLAIVVSNGFESGF